MLLSFLSIAPLEWMGIFSAIASGCIIGFERQLLGKPVGLRTASLISLGTYLFVAMSQIIMTEEADPSRVIGQIVTGIGFLGAGVMFNKNGLVVGVTSAAAIWGLASIGVIIGLGHYITGIKLSLLMVLILVGIDMIEGTFKFMQKGVHSRFNKKGFSSLGEASDNE